MSTAKPSRAIAVVGAGSWGTALANHLARAGHEVTLWDRDQATLRSIGEKHINERFFPGIELAESLGVESDLEKALSGKALVVFAVPSVAYREVARAAQPVIQNDTLLVSAAKGLENSTLSTMCSVLAAELQSPERIAVLSGPSFAREVVVGLPTAVTVASAIAETAANIARIFHHASFRVYTSDDVTGVELGGVVKNVIALAAGVIDGAGMGANARAALITRGLVELQRLVTALGGKPQTVMGLSGLGDLLLTATGDLSRNRQVGMRLAKGEKLEQIMRDLGQCAEAVTSANLLLELARKNSIEVPIIEEVAKFLSGKTTVQEGIKNLLTRPAKTEVS